MLNIWTLRNVLQNPDFEELQALAFPKGLDFVKYFATPDSRNLESAKYFANSIQ